MSRPRQGARRPLAATHAPAYPPPELILAERPGLRRMLLGYGVARGDVDDVLQDIAIGAHRSIQTGRFRPAPDGDGARALRRWLVGIAFKQLGHYHEKAHRRREVPMADPWEVVSEPVADAVATIEARDTLRLVRKLPQPYRRVLELAATGHGMSEIAAALTLPISTAASRVRRARRRLRALLARRPPAPAANRRASRYPPGPIHAGPGHCTESGR